MIMKKSLQVFLWVGIAALCFAPWAIAQNVSLTSAGSNVYDGVYVSPYYATVNGVANTPIVCDDFGDQSFLPSSWNASITPFSSISATNTSWDKESSANMSLYGAVGYLTGQVLGAHVGSQTQIIDTFALWAVFDPKGVEGYLASNPIYSGLTTAALCDDIFGGTSGCTSSVAGLGGLLYTAENSGFTASAFSNLQVLSPNVTGTNTLCTAESGNCPAQEFIVVTPEGGAAMAYLLLASLCCFGAMFLRSRRQIGTISAA